MNKPKVRSNCYSPVEELLNTLTHGVGFVGATVGLVLMLLKVDGLIANTICAVFGISMMLMFLSSTLYHGARKPSVKQHLKTFDHIAIYLLIAGTYTPYTILAVGGKTGLLAICSIWALALVGILCKIFASGRFPKVSLITYLSMGWLAVFFVYPLYQSLEPRGFWLLAAGGFSYTFGAIFYAAKHIQFTHTAWHFFVLIGCACHFWSIYMYVI